MNQAPAKKNVMLKNMTPAQKKVAKEKKQKEIERLAKREILREKARARNIAEEERKEQANRNSMIMIAKETELHNAILLYCKARQAYLKHAMATTEVLTMNFAALKNASKKMTDAAIACGVPADFDRFIPVAFVRYQNPHMSLHEAQIESTRLYGM